MHILSGRFTILFCLGALLAVTGCKKSYLSGGSLHNPVTPLNNVDYMKSNAFNLFDTAFLILQRFELINEVNNAKTFFAFTDYSVVNMMNLKLTARQQVNPLAIYTLDSLFKDLTADSIRQYIFNETIELGSASELKATPYTSRANTPMAVVKQLQTGAPYINNMIKSPTYLLYFVKVRGALDEPGVVPPQGENDISVLCQTTGIKTSNGATTMHVLVNNHTFVRF